MPDVEVQEEDVKVLKQELSQFVLTGKHHTLAFQYLTHLGYGLESFYKRKIGNSQFRLSIMEIKDEKRQHSVGSIQIQDTYCNIFYPPYLDAKEQVVIIAHEIGHFFLRVITTEIPEDSPHKGWLNNLNDDLNRLKFLNRQQREDPASLTSEETEDCKILMKKIEKMATLFGGWVFCDMDTFYKEKCKESHQGGLHAIWAQASKYLNRKLNRYNLSNKL